MPWREARAWKARVSRKAAKNAKNRIGQMAADPRAQASLLAHPGGVVTGKPL